MGTYGWPTPELNGPRTLLDAWRIEAATDLGVDPADLKFLAAELLPLVGSLQNTGTRTYCQDSPGTRISSGGAAGGFILLHLTTNITNTVNPQVLSAASGKWWLKMRARIAPTSGVIGAGSILGIGSKSNNVSDAAHDLVVGIDGSISTTNFVVNGSAGAAIDSGVPIDTLVREHKAWRDGSTTRYAINGVICGSGSARPGTDGRAIALVTDSAAVAQILDTYDWAVAYRARSLGV